MKTIKYQINIKDNDVQFQFNLQNKTNKPEKRKNPSCVPNANSIKLKHLLKIGGRKMRMNPKVSYKNPSEPPRTSKTP